MTNRFASARKFASKIVESNKLVPPIDPVSVIKSYGIEIIEEENQFGIEAFSDLGEIPRITINTEFTFPARKKFTLAHELGHIVIPWHNGDVKCDTDKPYNVISGQKLLDTQELEANIFASELLMPHNWIQRQIENSVSSFQNTLDSIKNKAQTSVMACLYALEEALPSGNLYYVRKENTDYWKKFSSQRTCSTALYGPFEKRIKFLEQICNRKEHFSISQYEIVYFSLLPCPEPTTIRKIYAQTADVIECINIITDYNPMKSFIFLDALLNALDDVYGCFVFQNDEYSRKVAHIKSNLINSCAEYDCFVHTLEYNMLSYKVLELEKYKFVFVKEDPVDLAKTRVVEPNSLLKTIAQEIYSNNYLTMLQRINGIVSIINSTTKIDDEKLLYNAIKYRFAGDYDMIEFYNHPDFDTYVVNKIKAMLRARISKRTSDK